MRPIRFCLSVLGAVLFTLPMMAGSDNATAAPPGAGPHGDPPHLRAPAVRGFHPRAPQVGHFHGLPHTVPPAGNFHVFAPHVGVSPAVRGFHFRAPRAGHFRGFPHVVPPPGGFHVFAPHVGVSPRVPLPGQFRTLPTHRSTRHYHFVAPAVRLARPSWHAPIAHWRRGHWWHGRHHGHFGWWWVVGPSFFWYSSQAWPYSETYPYLGYYWYWCDIYQQYYPYVLACPSGWRPVTPP
jgi:hypothetical protein